MFQHTTKIAAVSVRKDGPDEENLVTNGVRIPLFRKSSEYVWSGVANIGENLSLIKGNPYLMVECVGTLANTADACFEYSVTIKRDNDSIAVSGNCLITIDNELPKTSLMGGFTPQQFKNGDVVIFTVKRKGTDPLDTLPNDLMALGLFIASE